MTSPLIGSLDFSQIIQRKLTFPLNNDLFPKEGNENSYRGEQDALERMLADSNQTTEHQFESKYLAELADLRARAEAKQFSIDDGDDYYESYNNTVVGVLTLINPLHLYDLSDRNQT